MYYHLSTVSKDFICNVHPLQNIDPVFPSHLDGSSFALSLMLQIGKQDIISQITIIQIADHEHTDSIVGVSMNDYRRFTGWSRCGDVKSVELQYLIFEKSNKDENEKNS